jgi:hypothetical protein
MPRSRVRCTPGTAPGRTPSGPDNSGTSPAPWCRTRSRIDGCAGRIRPSPPAAPPPPTLSIEVSCLWLPFSRRPGSKCQAGFQPAVKDRLQPPWVSLRLPGATLWPLGQSAGSLRALCPRPPWVHIGPKNGRIQKIGRTGPFGTSGRRGRGRRPESGFSPAGRCRQPWFAVPLMG